MQHVFEIVGQDRLTPLVRELVGIKRNERAAHDEEQAEPDPGCDERGEPRPIERATATLCAGERIDDAAEQDRLGQRRRGKRYIGEREQPAERSLWPKQAEHAKNAALTLARYWGEIRLDNLLEGLARSLRVGVSGDTWRGRLQEAVDGTVRLMDVVADAWTFEDGKGSLTARLTFETGGERRVGIDVVFDKSEGRWVATRAEHLR